MPAVRLISSAPPFFRPAHAPPHRLRHKSLNPTTPFTPTCLPFALHTLSPDVRPRSRLPALPPLNLSYGRPAVCSRTSRRFLPLRSPPALPPQSLFAPIPPPSTRRTRTQGSVDGGDQRVEASAAWGGGYGGERPVQWRKHEMQRRTVEMACIPLSSLVHEKIQNGWMGNKCNEKDLAGRGRGQRGVVAADRRI